MIGFCLEWINEFSTDQTLNYQLENHSNNLHAKQSGTIPWINSQNMTITCSENSWSPIRFDVANFACSTVFMIYPIGLIYEFYLLFGGQRSLVHLVMYTLKLIKDNSYSNQIHMGSTLQPRDSKCFAWYVFLSRYVICVRKCHIRWTPNWSLPSIHLYL